MGIRWQRSFGQHTWERLVEQVVDGLNEESKEAVSRDRGFERARLKADFAHCFSVIESIVGRGVLERLVREALSPVSSPGLLAQYLADWPFRGYITTNYDNVLESALAGLKQRGWISVGNTDNEVRKVASDASEVVWHVHGGLNLDPAASRLILTDNDYDSLYLGETTVSRQLSGLLAQRRIVFFGFGFQDVEVKRVLHRVGQLTNPARPLFAVLPDLGGYESASDLKDLRDNYNVEVVPYTTTSGSHERLIELLSVHRSFTLRRSMRPSGRLPPAPSFDPETTSLLVYNQLCLRSGRQLPDDVLKTLLRARVLSLLRYRTSSTRSFLVADLEARTRQLRGMSDTTRIEAMLEQVLGEARRDGLVDMLPTGKDPEYLLTDSGRAIVEDQAATSERLRGQLEASFRSRAAELLSDGSSVDGLTAAATAFFFECVEKRALGVAATVNAPFEQARSYNLVGLLRELPRFMEMLASDDEAVALSRLVQGVLSRPTEAERRYLGLALQAQFGVHLLGADPAALAARTRELGTTVFLLDSTTLIPYLARSSVGYEGARLLVRLLSDAGATIATTFLLGVEVAEHARWALMNVGEGLLSVDGLRAASGRFGGRSNAFVDGLLEEVSVGRSHPDLLAFIGEACGCPPGAGTCRDSDVRDTLTRSGIPCISFENFRGYEAEMLVSRDELSGTIAELREERGSYRHERQVRAEAEALVLVQGFRNGVVRVGDDNVTNGFFVSHTRVIDNAAAGGPAITIRPEAVLQWVTALMPCPPDELGALVSLLLYELKESGVEIVDRVRLQTTFAPLISASRESLADEVEKNRLLVTSLYGESAERAFRDVRAEDAPLVLQGFYAQQAKTLAAEVDRLAERVHVAEAKGKMSEEERKQFERLKLEKGERKRAERKRRAAARGNPSRRSRKKRGR